MFPTLPTDFDQFSITIKFLGLFWEAVFFTIKCMCFFYFKMSATSALGDVEASVYKSFFNMLQWSEWIIMHMLATISLWFSLT